MEVTRRRFLAAASALASGSILGVRSLSAQSQPPSDLRVGVIGLRKRGVHHLTSLRKQITAVCDVDAKILTVRAREASARMGRKIQPYADYRKMLESPEIDAVSIATPNHLHALIAVAALQAGKHVFVEKPLAHNMWEGEQIVAAAEKYGKVVQCGMQVRSSRAVAKAIEFVQSGELGAIQYAMTTCYKSRMSIGLLKNPLKIPKTIDYDRWCGPAAKVDIFRPSLHYDWNWDFNTGNGDLGNQAVHHLDIARWCLGEEDLPPRTLSIGGRVGYEDAGETPNTQVVLFDYEKAPIVTEVRGLPRSKADWTAWESAMDSYRGVPIGAVIQCERGYIGVSAQYQVAVALDNDNKLIKKFDDGAVNHYQNWMDACMANDTDQLSAPVLEGHRTCALVHAGNISHRTGAPATRTEILERLDSLKVPEIMSETTQRMMEHLKKNQIDIESPTLVLGSALAFLPTEKRFSDNDAANALLKREGRPGFEVPNLLPAAAAPA